jgi:hypothetical protein
MSFRKFVQVLKADVASTFLDFRGLKELQQGVGDALIVVAVATAASCDRAGCILCYC